MMVTCKIKGCYMTTLNAKTHSGINCNIENIPENQMQNYKKEQVIQGKITQINFERQLLTLTISP